MRKSETTTTTKGFLWERQEEDQKENLFSEGHIVIVIVI
jgi:hypothetical protein